jgi:hypothetical protein
MEMNDYTDDFGASLNFYHDTGSEVEAVGYCHTVEPEDRLVVIVYRLCDEKMETDFEYQNPDIAEEIQDEINPDDRTMTQKLVADYYLYTKDGKVAEDTEEYDVRHGSLTGFEDMSLEEWIEESFFIDAPREVNEIFDITVDQKV